MSSKENDSLRERNPKDEPEIPEDIKAYKEKLEKETGKKYKYRSPKRDLPGIKVSSHVVSAVSCPLP